MWCCARYAEYKLRLACVIADPYINTTSHLESKLIYKVYIILFTFMVLDFYFQHIGVSYEKQWKNQQQTIKWAHINRTHIKTNTTRMESERKGKKA